jgi:hypothetical protein
MKSGAPVPQAADLINHWKFSLPAKGCRIPFSAVHHFPGRKSCKTARRLYWSVMPPSESEKLWAMHKQLI